MFVKYFSFQDIDSNLYPLFLIKGTINKFETQMPMKKYIINLITKNQNMYFYYNSESVRDLIYDKLIRLKGKITAVGNC